MTVGPRFGAPDEIARPPLKSFGACARQIHARKQRLEFSGVLFAATREEPRWQMLAQRRRTRASPESFDQQIEPGPDINADGQVK